MGTMKHCLADLLEMSTSNVVGEYYKIVHSYFNECHIDGGSLAEVRYFCVRSNMCVLKWVRSQVLDELINLMVK